MEKYYNHKESEIEKIKQWEESQTYKFDKSSKKELFSIDTPPPTVSGSLHIGHIFSYTQTDIIARFQRMSGKNVFYPFGFDDNGLPTEKFVEKKLKVSGYHLGRSKFIDLCLKESHEVEEVFKNLWQKMGLSVDWNYTYSTISESTRKLAQESFIKLYNNGFIYKKIEPALYCPSCFTAVAQAELDDKEVPSKFNDIVFKLNDGTELIVGTTRPELLASCTALLYHPDDKRYQHLKGKKAIVPFYNFEVEILPDDEVTIDKGTGLVMCCTFGDKKDVEWFKKHNLPYKESISRDGKFNSSTGPLEGLRAKNAREKILELLKENNLLKDQKDIVHVVSVHERCKKEVEIISIPQWFVKVIEFKNEFLKIAEEISWYPEHMKFRYKNWVENLSWDWCISRQRFYGIPFPVWYCNDCNKIILAKTENLPVDPQEQKPEKCECGGSNITPDNDVMDTWNTSSITPFIVANMLDSDNVFENKINFIPMSMRPQAHDIIRTWSFYTIVKSWMHLKEKPWKEIVISGHVLAGGSEKISKSKGNAAFDPETLMQNYSADAIRYWTASANLGQDVVFSDTQLKAGNRLLNKLWNAFKFCKEHLDENAKHQNELGDINNWILYQINDCYKKYSSYLNKNEFHAALIELEKFFWSDFCDNYLELIKHLLFNPNEYSKELVESTKWTLYEVGFKILQLYAPYIPFETEVLYELIYKNSKKYNSIHLTEFGNFIDVDKKYKDKTEIILNVVENVRKLKTEKQLSLGAPLEILKIYANKEALEILKNNETFIKGVTKAQDIKYFEANDIKIEL